MRFACSLALVLAALAVTHAAPAQKTQIVSAPHVQRRSALTHTGAPYSPLMQNQIAIYLQWDVSLQSDLDQIFYDTISCLTCMKINHIPGATTPIGGAGPYCELPPVPTTEAPITPLPSDDANNYIPYSSTFGGGAMNFESWVYPFGNPLSLLNADSTSTTPTNAYGASGMEFMLITQPLPGTYHHFVYNFGNPSHGFKGAGGIRVDLWSLDPVLNVPVSTSLAIDAVPQPAGLQECYGRYWNTFKIQVLEMIPLKFNITVINTVTSTPFTAMGTNGTQVFEDGIARNNVGCAAPQ